MRLLYTVVVNSARRSNTTDRQRTTGYAFSLLTLKEKMRKRKKEKEIRAVITFYPVTSLIYLC